MPTTDPFTTWKQPLCLESFEGSLASEKEVVMGTAQAGALSTDSSTLRRDSAAAMSVFPRELYQAPQRWTEQAYPDLIYSNELDRGNHTRRGRSRGSSWTSPGPCSSH